jgi:fatty-acyl-CoA synthase
VLWLNDSSTAKGKTSISDMTQYKTLIEPLYEAPDDKTFVTICEGDEPVQAVSFGQFRRLAETQALDFAAKGLCQGDCVVLVMPQGISLMAAFVGAMLLGAVPSILAYPNFKLDPVKYRTGLSGVSKNLNARLIVIDEQFPSDLLTCIEGLPNGAKVVRTVGSALTARAAELRPFSDTKTGQLAFIQHSAGTTGLQKGVALTHAAVLRQLNHLVDALRITRDDRIYSWLPLYHDMGLIACFMLPMVCGLSITMQSPTDWVMQPATMLKIISDNRCTLAWLPNFAFQFTARRVPCELRKRFDLSSMRMFINCSEPVRASSMDEFFSAFASCGLQPSALQTSYAMAENVFAVTQSGSRQNSTPFRAYVDSQIFRDEHRAIIVDKSVREATEFVSSGRCLRENEIKIVSEAGADVEEGHVVLPSKLDSQGLRI